MKVNRLIALMIMTVGIMAFAYQGLSYATRQKAFDIDLIQVTVGQVSIVPAIIGSLALLCGLIMLFLEKERQQFPRAYTFLRSRELIYLKHHPKTHALVYKLQKMMMHAH